MDAKRCDKCGGFFDTSDEYTILSFKTLGELLYTSVDLCEKCSKEFRTFLETPRKEK